MSETQAARCLLAKRIRTIGLVIVAVLFIVSLAGETLLYDGDSSFLVGIACLLFGFGYVPWFANPCLALSALSLLNMQVKWATASSMAALLLALTSTLIREVPRNEAGTLAPVIGYGLGFYLWTGSIVALLVTSLSCLTFDSPQNGASAPQGSSCDVTSG